MSAKIVSFTDALLIGVIDAAIVCALNWLFHNTPNSFDSVFWVFVGAMNVWLSAPRITRR